MRQLNLFTPKKVPGVFAMGDRVTRKGPGNAMVPDGILTVREVYQSDEGAILLRFNEVLQSYFATRVQHADTPCRRS